MEMAPRIVSTIIRNRRALQAVLIVPPLLCFFFLYYDPELSAVLSDPGRPRMLCSQFDGGLGNRLFQYAFVLAMSAIHNVTPVFPKDSMKPLQEVFLLPYPESTKAEQRACLSLPFTTLRYDSGYDPAVQNLTFTSDLHLIGYYQSWCYFRHYVIESELRRHFRFRPEILKQRDEVMAQILAAYPKDAPLPTLVGVHIRRGDMVKDEVSLQYGYRVPGPGYFQRAIQRIRSQVSGPVLLLVASNDVVWARAAIESPDAVFLQGHSPGLDMALLASADHFVMSVGTFGWWVAWHVPGTVIYFNQPFRTYSVLATKFSPDYAQTYFDPRWIGMD